MFQSLLENSHSELLESFPKQNYSKAKNFALKGTAPCSSTADASPWWHPCVTLIRVGQDHQGLMGAGLHFLQIHIPEFLSLTFLFSVFRKDLELVLLKMPPMLLISQTPGPDLRWRLWGQEGVKGRCSTSWLQLLLPSGLRELGWLTFPFPLHFPFPHRVTNGITSRSRAPSCY